MPGKLLATRLFAAALLLAFLPTLTFIGHWDEIFGGSVLAPISAPPSQAMWFDIAAQRADQQQHEQHCHTSLGSCSEQPMPAGAGFLITQDTLLPPPPLPLSARVSTLQLPLHGLVARPLLPPPRLAI